MIAFKFYCAYTYRVAHLLWERNMLTSTSKFRHWPSSQDKFTAKRNFKFGVNISFSRSRWATLYLHVLTGTSYSVTMYISLLSPLLNSPLSIPIDFANYLYSIHASSLSTSTFAVGFVTIHSFLSFKVFIVGDETFSFRVAFLLLFFEPPPRGPLSLPRPTPCRS